MNRGTYLQHVRDLYGTPRSRRPRELLIMAASLLLVGLVCIRFAATSTFLPSTIAEGVVAAGLMASAVAVLTRRRDTVRSHGAVGR